MQWLRRESSPLSTASSRLATVASLAPKEAFRIFVIPKVQSEVSFYIYYDFGVFHNSKRKSVIFQYANYISRRALLGLINIAFIYSTMKHKYIYKNT